jgi:hypothetical protein
MKDVNVTDFLNLVQELAHAGYAMHTIRTHTKCNNCETDVVIENPKVSFIIDDATKTFTLKFEEQEEHKHE